MTQETKKQVSDKLMPKPIPVGEVRKFKLLTAGVIDPATNKPAFNAGAIFSGITTIYDQGSARPVTIRNITGESIVEDAKGNQKVQDIVSDVEFDSSGMVYVNHMQPQLYLYLSRHNNCATNPFRDKTKQAIWEEIIPVNIKERQKFQMDLEYDSLTIVKSLDAKELVAMAEVLCNKRLIDVNVNGNLSDVRYEVEKFCKINPTEIIRASREKLPIIKLDIQDACNIKEIEFFGDNNEWQWTNKFGKEKHIMSVTPGHDPIDSLAKYILETEEKNAALPVDKRVQKTLLKEIKNTLKELSV